MEQRHADTALGMTARGQTSAAPHSQSVRKIAFAAASTDAAQRLYGPLFKAITALGHKVLCLTPQDAGNAALPASDTGIEFTTYDPKPEGWSFLVQRRALQALSDALKESRAHGIVATADGALLPLLAAGQAGITQRTAVFTGRFDATDAAVQAWRKVLEASSSAVFLNRGDRQAALKAGVLAKSLPVSVVPGAGIDLTTASALPVPPLSDGLVFLMHVSSHQAQHSGTIVQAASAFVTANPGARVILSGYVPKSDRVLPAGVSVTLPDANTEPVSAVRAALAQCHVFVQGPHNEAMPAAGLEALAAGRAIISMDTGGDRDLVDELVNGCLVSQPTATAYLQAMDLFVKQPDLISVAARASRLKAERWFDQRNVNQAWLKALALQV